MNPLDDGIETHSGAVASWQYLILRWDRRGPLIHSNNGGEAWNPENDR
jgi:hypothetical protein